MTKHWWMLLLLAGCKKNDGVPAWAFDPIWIEPHDGDIVGFQKWELFSEPWNKRYKERFYVCSVVVEFDGTEAEPDCDDCGYAWDVTTSLLESDCADAITEDPGYLSLTRIGLGRVPPALAEDDPYPAKSYGTYADYGTGDWEQYGWGYPEGLDSRAEDAPGEWGDDPFQLWPAFVWDL